MVTIAINEGPVYKLGTVALAGVPSAEVAQLDKSGDWHKGDTANFTRIEAQPRKDPPAPARARLSAGHHQRDARHPR